MEGFVNARFYLENISTPRTSEIVEALLPGIRGNIFLYEKQQDFLRDRLEEFADYRNPFEFALAVTQLALVINVWR